MWKDSQLRVFLCHSSGDKHLVRQLYDRLRDDGFAPWLDEKELLPGINWREEIPRAVRGSDAVIVCLSKDFQRAGYRQKEVRLALEIVEEQPEGGIFLIPVKLEECEVPAALSHWQWANLFEPGGYDLLVRALRVRSERLASDVKPSPSLPVPEAIGSSNEGRVRRLTVPAGKRMIYIPGGKFPSGPNSEIREIGGFWIDETPVTNEEFVQFVEASGYLQNNPYRDTKITDALAEISRAARKQPDHPVTLVTWFDAKAYATWADKRLLTADEWERAARGTGGILFPWGNEFESAFCNCKDSKIGHTTPVYKYGRGRSPEGCFDMAGNVFEWVNDWAKDSRFSNTPLSEKINRGGSFNRPMHNLLCYYFESDPPDARMIDVGFRCASSCPGPGSS